MSKRIFTPEQIKELLQNPNVSGCSEKSLSYHKDFKIQAVKKYYEGMPGSEIFRQAEFNMNLIGYTTPKDCLRRWKRIFKAKGNTGLEIDGRGQHKSGGRRRGAGHLSDKEKLKYLEAEVAYLKAENSFLAKLRKKSLN